MVGHRQRQLAHCSRALSLCPSHGPGFYLLCLDTASQPRTELCHTVKQQVEDGRISASDRTYMLSGLALLHEKHGDYDAAFNYFTRGNFLKRQTISFGSAGYASQAAAVCQQVGASPLRCPGAANATEMVPIFIVGMPRSGTTLVEQILHQHTCVHGAGEQLFIEALIKQHESQSGASYPAFMEHITADELSRLGRSYLASLCGVAPRNTPIVIDKLPGNFMHVGFIKSILPHAKSIYCTRHYLDTAVSIYRQIFSGNVPYAYDLEEIGAASAVCAAMMRHWKAVHGETCILEVAYEDVVRNTRGEVERMLRFLGLSWGSKCLEFHHDWRLVRTASYEQVQRPFYLTSVGIHRPYEGSLEPMIPAFEQYSEFMLPH